MREVHTALKHAVEKLTFCLAESKDGYHLKYDYAYYYQVCLQLECVYNSWLLYLFTYRCSVNCSVQNGHTVTLWFGLKRKSILNKYTQTMLLA